MSISITSQITNEVTILQSHIVNLFTIHDFLIFYSTLQKINKLLIQIENNVRTRDGKYGIKFPMILLTNIFRYLPWEERFCCLKVCHLWYDACNSNYAKQILPQCLRPTSLPFQAHFLHSFQDKIFAFLQNFPADRVQIYQIKNGLLEHTGNHKLQSDIGLYGKLAVNHKNIFLLDTVHVRRFSYQGEKIMEWSIPRGMRKLKPNQYGILATSQYLYIHDTFSIFRYSFDGKKLEETRPSFTFTSLGVAENNEIFILSKNMIKVYRNQVLQRQWALSACGSLMALDNSKIFVYYKGGFEFDYFEDAVKDSKIEIFSTDGILLSTFIPICEIQQMVVVKDVCYCKVNDQMCVSLSL